MNTRTYSRWTTRRRSTPTVVGTKAAGLARAAGRGLRRARRRRARPSAWPTTGRTVPLPSAIRARGRPRRATRSGRAWRSGRRPPGRTARPAPTPGATATVLDVSGVDAVLDAIRHCLDASADGAAPLARARRRGHRAAATRGTPTTPAWPSPPTRSPASATSCASPPPKGSGEALVQGEVVGSDVTVARRRPSTATWPGCRPSDARGGGRRWPGRSRPSFGRPQDIEWAVARRRRPRAAGPPHHRAAGRAAPARGQQLAEGRRPLPRAAHPVRLVAHAGVRRRRSTGCSTRWACWCGGSRRSSSAARSTAGSCPAFGSADDARQAAAGVRAGRRRPGRAGAAAAHRRGPARPSTPDLGAALGRRVARDRPRRDGPPGRGAGRRRPRRTRRRRRWSSTSMRAWRCARRGSRSTSAW